LVVSAISESIKIDASKLEQSFAELAEKHVNGEISGGAVEKKEDKITGERLEEEAEDALADRTQIVKPNKEQPAMTAARRKDKRTKPLIKEEKIPETLRKDKRQDQVQMTLDKVTEKARSKGRKSN
jgi:hypothetical protein